MRTAKTPEEFSHPDCPDATFFQLSFDYNEVKAKDINGILGCRTNNYLDVHYPIRSMLNIIVVAFVSFFIVFVIDLMINVFRSWVTLKAGAGSDLYSIFIFALSISFGATCLAILYHIFIPPPLPIMRFNRERKQVYIRINKEYICVNWYEILPKYYHAKRTERSTVIMSFGGYTTTKTYIIYTLAFFIEDIKSNSGHKMIYFFGCESEKDVLHQWECIRSFMEEGSTWPESKDNCTNVHKGDDPKARFKNWVFGRKKPTFSENEILEWSKPLNIQ